MGCDKIVDTYFKDEKIEFIANFDKNPAKSFN